MNHYLRVSLYALLLVALQGCKFHTGTVETSAFTSASQPSIYTFKDHPRTITVKVDGEVTVYDGEIRSASPETIMTIADETRGKIREAKVNETNGDILFTVKHGSNFVEGTEAERAWLKEVLLLVPIGSIEEVAKEIDALSAETDTNAMNEVIGAVQGVPMPSDRQALLEQLAKNETLSPESQVLIVDTIYDHLPMHSDKADTLTVLIQNPNLSSQARSRITARIEELPMSSDQVKILKLLVE